MNELSTDIRPQIDESWRVFLQEDFNNDCFLKLKIFLLEEKKNYKIFPPGKEIFTAFNLTPLDKVKVIILGQDPYHGIGQAHGLCFSVPDGVKPPPSLLNIYKELKNDLQLSFPASGNLSSWAKQGVLLLNATLTVRMDQAGSHQGRGWEEFTNGVIRKLAKTKRELVFILWGKFAQQKEVLIPPERHLILKSAHPSPFSAHHGFFGCKHFSKTNAYLLNRGKEAIDWNPI